VGNKRDLLQEATAGGLPAGLPAPVLTCALTGDGLEELFDAVERCVWGQPHPEQPEVAVSARHAFLLDSACNFLERARDRLQEESWELAAESLRLATRELDRVTGKAVAPDILDSIFSRFCIGK
jgi:tRNA modification GTPase